MGRKNKNITIQLNRRIDELLRIGEKKVKVNGRELAYAVNCTMVHEFSTALNEWGGSICKTNAALFTFDEDYGIIKTKRVGKLACQ